MSKPFHWVLATALALPAAAIAATSSSLEKAEALRNSDAEYHQDAAYCRGLKGEEEAACKAKAQAARDRAKADTAQAYRESDKKLDAANRESRAEHRAANAECAALKGDQQRKCLADARAVRERQRVQAFNAAGEDRLEANYRAERARCDSMTEADKPTCVARVDAKYGKK